MGRVAFTPEESPSGSGGGVTSSPMMSEQCVLLEELLTPKCSQWPAGISLVCGEASFVSASAQRLHQRCREGLTT